MVGRNIAVWVVFVVSLMGIGVMLALFYSVAHGGNLALRVVDMLGKIFLGES